jgi:predicted lipid-binding transport protein (Tim44 family)
MVRNLVGLTVFGCLAIVALKIFFGLFFGLFAIALFVLKWALIGWVIYTIIKILSPETARRIKQMFQGESAA